MQWWIWILLGFGLLAAEAVTPGGFFVLFFGVSAILVGILSWLGSAGPDWMQWLLFSVLTVASLLLIRPRLVDRFRTASGNTSLPGYVGDVAIVLEDLEPGSVGKAELRGTSWNVRSRGRVTKGTRCKVERIEGLTLWLTPPGDS